jgi:hypothetical protein
MRRCGQFVLLGLCSLLLMSPAAQAQKRVALVIGNSAYQNAGLLDNPKNDATDVAEALKKHGFQVIAGFDLDKAGMDQKICEFAEGYRARALQCSSLQDTAFRSADITT